MKINAINSIRGFSLPPQQLKSKDEKSEYTTRPIDLNLLNYANLSLISFKGKDFSETVDCNYFQFPIDKTTGKPFEADVFQKAAARNLNIGNDVLVTAPTGTGKTAIAHYVITKNLEEGKRTFYTSPLKALSNEKYRSFQKIYGADNVGLMTGDVKENQDAPIILMTTEIYRNMVFGDKFGEQNPDLDNLGTVIFDEVHYIGDVDRGGVWEQSIILSDPKTQLLSLSATIGNNEEISDWMATVKGLDFSEKVTPDATYNVRSTEDTAINAVLINVPPENRHVPLEFGILDVKPEKPKSGSGSKGQKIRNKKLASKRNASEDAFPSMESFKNTVSDLKAQDKLPAIFFVFSKRKSRVLLREFAHSGEVLTTTKEQQEIQNIIDNYTKVNGKYLGESLNINALLKGYAIHNSGLLPAQKELIEELFQKKLIKVVIATETLAAGINMPARTTVITATRKPSSNSDRDDGKRDIEPNEFHQMAGRAGRRGIDTKGYCYVMSCNPLQKSKFKSLIAAKPNELKSSFKPDFSFIAGYYNTCKTDSVIKELLEKSLYAFDNDPEIHDKKTKELIKVFKEKRNILKTLKYIDADKNLTIKGKLLAKLNGYEQIPIVEAVKQKRLTFMEPAELAAAVATLSALEYPNEKFVKPDELYRHKNEAVDRFVRDLNEILKNYNPKSGNEKPLIQNNDVTEHIYEWAKMNNESENSEANWKSLYSGDLKKTIRDEGSLFKEIMSTIDLLKQIAEMTQVGESCAENSTDILYYKDLRKTCNAAIELLAKEPVV